MPAVSQGQREIRLLRTGTFLIDQPRTDPSEQWFGLRKADSEWALVRVVPSIWAVEDACSGRATRISVDGATDFLVLIEGALKLAEGSVSATIHSPRFLYPGEGLDVGVRRHDGYTLEALGRAHREVGGVVFEDYQLWIRRRRQTQLIASFERTTIDNPRQLLWAGDIDRDARPDPLFNFPLGDVGDNYVLFLSSYATATELVSRVAQFSTPGC